ncbi:MAG: hypothetical protein EXQ56_09140 [Acidobacteria bacterium]|nr:hypothetical protein [Acidobacteriota bacterium]
MIEVKKNMLPLNTITVQVSTINLQAHIGKLVARTRSILFAITIALVLTSSASASLPEKFGDWQGSPLKAITDGDLSATAGENAAIFREYGFVSGDQREYIRGGEKLTATLWKMRDATGSLGIFTFFNGPGRKVEKVSEDVISTGNGSLYLWRGAYLLEARGPEIARDELPALTAEIPATDDREAVLPALPSFFPIENLIPLSRKFVVGPLGLGRVLTELPAAKLGLEHDTEAAVAKYNIGNTAATLLLILYPTPQLAAKKFSEFLDLPEVAGGTGLPHVLMQRKGSLVALVIGAPTPTEATRLLDRVNYQTSLMWNEFTEPGGRNVGNLILAVFSLAGTVIAFALVAGLAFGGFRVFAKKYIPFPIFDRPVDAEITKLHLDQK